MYQSMLQLHLLSESKLFFKKKNQAILVMLHMF